MEDYIYILIGIIWLAASIYKAANKKKKAVAPQAEAEGSEVQQSQGRPKPRSLFEELMGGHEIQLPEPEMHEIYDEDEHEAVRVEQKKPSGSFQEEYAKFGFKGLEKLKSEGESSTDRISFRDEMKNASKKSSSQKHIDLRKAIIYSTILERPYT